MAYLDDEGLTQIMFLPHVTQSVINEFLSDVKAVLVPSLKHEDQYENISNDYSLCHDYSIGLYKYLENHTFLTLLGEVEGKDIIDLGCGEGFYTRLIKTRNVSGEVCGLDISQSMIDEAKAKSEGINFITGDCSRPLNIEKQYDIVTNQFLLCHVSTPEMM